jgi:hypothetical protein
MDAFMVRSRPYTASSASCPSAPGSSASLGSSLARSGPSRGLLVANGNQARGRDHLGWTQTTSRPAACDGPLGCVGFDEAVPSGHVTETVGLRPARAGAAAVVPA